MMQPSASMRAGPKEYSSAPSSAAMRMARQVPALAGLGALGHLDVELVGEGAVLRRHTETAGGDLLDAGVAVLRRSPGAVAVAALAALAAVVAGPDQVEGQGQRLVGLGRPRAVRPGPRREAP